MAPTSGFWSRFIRLLPYLGGLSPCRCFHPELFYPYPDVWNGQELLPSHSGPASTQSDQANAAQATGGPVPSGATRASVRRPGTGATGGPIGRPYLTPMEMHGSRCHRTEPFC
jgi:hypothetical protein